MFSMEKFGTDLYSTISWNHLKLLIYRKKPYSNWFFVSMKIIYLYNCIEAEAENRFYLFSIVRRKHVGKNSIFFMYAPWKFIHLKLNQFIHQMHFL